MSKLKKTVSYKAEFDLGDGEGAEFSASFSDDEEKGGVFIFKENSMSGISIPKRGLDKFIQELQLISEVIGNSK